MTKPSSESVFEATFEDLLRFVERCVHPLAAEDVVAEVFLIAWRRLSDVPAAPEEARAWLFAVAQRSLANQRRGDARRLSLQVRIGQQAPHETASEDHSAAVAARVDLAHAWSRLSPGDQEVLTLTSLDQLTGQQAAQVLGISPTAFSLRLLRARRRLRRHLKRATPDVHRAHSDSDDDSRSLASQRPPRP
jgi:RNA polymerase sigma-70 factor (ECF subfamily)